ncbi:NACHT domain-containing protein [Archangium sp.]|uniref:NACHT domain-containing protein n=1 Tax=Archangium sp. TaxID=1872627 RepID=UPI00286A3EEB|nr:NACHT domain-containing protein [Archangium sp.]
MAGTGVPLRPERVFHFAGIRTPHWPTIWLVVSGGPGAGKSTLLRYVAHRKSSAGRLVARVQLKLVALRLQRGDTFEQALSRVAGDGSGVPAHRCEELLANPELLLADGLDECGADASSMGEALKKWSHGHQGTTVIVTTRPVGYEAARFADWTHLELLPLQREEPSRVQSMTS